LIFHTGLPESFREALIGNRVCDAPSLVARESAAFSRVSDQFQEALKFWTINAALLKGGFD